MTLLLTVLTTTVRTCEISVSQVGEYDDSEISGSDGGEYEV
jgi:hypothetical protein